MARDFVRAIDIDRQVGDVVQIVHLDAVFAQALCRGLGAGDRAVDLVFDLAELVDEVIGGRAGADADDAAHGHMCDRRFGNGLFEFVLSHGAMLAKIRIEGSAGSS